MTKAVLNQDYLNQISGCKFVIPAGCKLVAYYKELFLKVKVKIVLYDVNGKVSKKSRVIWRIKDADDVMNGGLNYVLKYLINNLLANKPFA